MMNVLAWLSGTVNNGWYSALSGEGLWTTNLMRVLADHGCSVTGIGGGDGPDALVPGAPSWGECPRHPNVRWMRWDSIGKHQEYDVSLATPEDIQIDHGEPFSHCTDLLRRRLNAKLVVHNKFGYSDGILRLPCKNDHVLAFATESSRAAWVNVKGVFRVYFLPLPLSFSSFRPVVKGKRDLVWVSKHTFHPDFDKTVDHPLPRNGICVLRALARFCEKYDDVNSVHFFAGKEMFDSGWTPFVERFDMLKLLARLKNPVLHDYMRRDQTFEILRTSKIIMPVSGLGPWAWFDGVTLGSLPLTWQNTIHFEGAKQKGLLLPDTKVATESEMKELEDLVFEHLERIWLFNDKEYEETIKLYREVDLKVHEHDFVWSRWCEMIEAEGLKA